MSGYSRRDFLARSSVALAGIGIGLRPGQLRALPPRSIRPVAELLPDLVDADTLRKLAQAAMDAARSAGATYADIRIANRRMLDMMYFLHRPDIPPISSLGFDYSYGVRVRVDGGWAFASGADPTVDGVAGATRKAVGRARDLAKVSGSAPDFVAAPVVTGEWATPVKIDPFSVSPDEHAYMLGAYMEATSRALGADTQPSFYWQYETRVFASTEGSLVTQRLAQARPRVTVDAEPNVRRPAHLPVTEIAPESAGFEITQGSALQERIKAVADETTRLLAYPIDSVEVGRYPAVLDGSSIGAVLGATLAPALELDRVLGLTADAAGTSFLAPPTAILGAPLFSSVLNVSADRALPHLGAARWDDEGVATEAFPVIQHGAVVDYFATRGSAAVLAPWYTSRGMPVRAHGSAVAWTASREPVGSASSLMVHPGAAGASLDALTRDLGTGLLLRGVSDAFSDQQLTSGTLFPAMLFEVKRGQITRRFAGGAVQFSTTKFWKSLTTLGDESSVQHYVHEGEVGDELMEMVQPIRAPAGHVQELNVVQIESRVR
jgi:TldD protein